MGCIVLTCEVSIRNKLGLHARASSKFTQLACAFPQAEVWLIREASDRYSTLRVNGKSIMGVMMLAAAQGSLLTLEVDGPQEGEALTALCSLIDNFFDEAD